MFTRRDGKIEEMRPANSKGEKTERRPRCFSVGDVGASGVVSVGLSWVKRIVRAEMKHSFTRSLTARKVDFMMIIIGKDSKSGWLLSRGELAYVTDRPTCLSVHAYALTRAHKRTRFSTFPDALSGSNTAALTVSRKLS